MELETPPTPPPKKQRLQTQREEQAAHQTAVWQKVAMGERDSSYYFFFFLIKIKVWALSSHVQARPLSFHLSNPSLPPLPPTHSQLLKRAFIFQKLM